MPASPEQLFAERLRDSGVSFTETSIENDAQDWVFMAEAMRRRVAAMLTYAATLDTDDDKLFPLPTVDDLMGAIADLMPHPEFFR